MSQSFQTAAARRRGELLAFDLTGVIYPADPESEDAPEVVTVTVKVDPRLDAIRLGAAFGQFGRALKSIGADDADADTLIAMLDKETPRARARLRECLIPPSRVKFDTISDSVDLQTLGEVIRWLTKELSGVDPTQAGSSSDGSSTTTESSTPGAQPEE